MKSALLKIICLITAIMTVAFAWGGCGDEKKEQAGVDEDGWFGWLDDVGEDGNAGEYIFTPTIPTYSFSGETIWVGAEDCSYDKGTAKGELNNPDGAKYEEYDENHDGNIRKIVTQVEGVTFKFIVSSANDADVSLTLRAAVEFSAEWGTRRWASDKFSLTVNDSAINLNGVDGTDEKWIWQQAEWYTNANYIDFNLGTVHLNAGENTFAFRVGKNVTDEVVPESHVQMDCFIINVA